MAEASDRAGAAPPPAAHGQHLHLHLWTSPEGHRLHAPFGELAREESTGRLCCHLCGQRFAALGSHLRRHGWTAAEYRAAMGLGRTTSLAGPGVSTAISRRQARRYAADPAHRAALDGGQAMARDGSLAEAARRAAARGPTPQHEAARRAALDAGRATQRQQRALALADRLAGTGHPDLPAYLRDRYTAGASLADLAGETGLGRARLRDALVEAGAAVRPTGATTPAGRRARALAADRAAAERVGADDVRRWLKERAAGGWSLLRMSAAVDRSPPWVRSRLADGA